MTDDLLGYENLHHPCYDERQHQQGQDLNEDRETGFEAGYVLPLPTEVPDGQEHRRQNGEDNGRVEHAFVPLFS